MRDTMNLMEQEQRRVVDGYTYWMMRVHYDTSSIRNPKRIPCRRVTNQPTSTQDLAEWMQLNPTPVLAGSDRHHYGRQLFDLQIPLWTPRQVCILSSWVVRRRHFFWTVSALVLDGVVGLGFLRFCWFGYFMSECVLR